MRPNLLAQKSTFPRRGSVVPFLLVSLTVFLAAFALAVNKYWLWSLREELKTAADAAALASAADLADDDLLRGDPQNYPALLERAAQSAIALGGANLVRTQPLLIQDNLTNDSRGDVVFGSVSTPRAGDFQPVSSREAAQPDQSRANTAVVATRLTRTRGNAPGLIFGLFAGVPYADVQAISAATLDRGVRGFQPRFAAVPLMPIALLGDGSPLSWQTLVENGGGPDAITINRSNHRIMPGPDLIREFEGVYPAQSDQLPNGNSALVFLPDNDAKDLPRQIAEGFSEADFLPYGGKLLLPDTGTKDFAGRRVGEPSAPASFQDIAAALTRLQDSGEPRVWPLYSGFVADTNTVQISGFIAARVVSVAAPVAGEPLRFTVQATVLIVPSAVTDTDLRGADATLNDNRYVCKLRRIE